MARRRRKSKAEGQGINTQTLLVVAVLGYWMFAGGGGNPRPQPGPGPEPTPDIVEDEDTPTPSGARDLGGFLVFIHDRDPMSPEDQQIILDVAKFTALSDGKSEYRSLDTKDPKTASAKEKAAAEGVNPPFVYHKSANGESVVFVPMAGTWNDIKKELESK